MNVATLVPNGNLRIAAVDDVARRAMASETRDMARLLEAALDAGAFGLSTGLEYLPEHHASEEEIIELCRIVAARGGLYATHERERDLLAIEAVEEGIRASMASGVRLQLSHLIPRRGAPDGALEAMIGLAEAAVADGLDVQFDAHTGVTVENGQETTVSEGDGYDGGGLGVARRRPTPRTTRRNGLSRRYTSLHKPRSGPHPAPQTRTANQEVALRTQTSYNKPRRHSAGALSHTTSLDATYQRSNRPTKSLCFVHFLR